MLAATFSGASDEFCAARAFIGVWGSGHAFCTRQLGARRADSGVVKKCINSGGESGIIKLGVCRHFLHAPTGGERGRFGVWYAEWSQTVRREYTLMLTRRVWFGGPRSRRSSQRTHKRHARAHPQSQSHTAPLSVLQPTRDPRSSRSDYKTPTAALRASPRDTPRARRVRFYLKPAA